MKGKIGQCGVERDVAVKHCDAGAVHVRYENLKDVVLNELLAEHDHAELDAQLDEAAWRGALCKRDKHSLSRQRRSSTREKKLESGYLLHAVVSKNVNVVAGPPSKPERADDGVRRGGSRESVRRESVTRRTRTFL